MIFMRPATMADADYLFEWRNDPITQASFRSTSEVLREDHDRWMKFNVENGYPTHIVMIADHTDFGALGVVRFDTKPNDDIMTYEASITMAPKHRGKHLGHDVLDLACKYMAEYDIKAEIRTGNGASRRLFESCGFEETGSDHDFVRYRKGHQ